jgi:hypothetical protein
MITYASAAPKYYNQTYGEDFNMVLSSDKNNMLHIKITIPDMGWFGIGFGESMI